MSQIPESEPGSRPLMFTDANGTAFLRRPELHDFEADCVLDCKVLVEGAVLPTIAYEHDMGWDLYAWPLGCKHGFGACAECKDFTHQLETFTLWPKYTANIFTGVAVCPPAGWGLALRGRSSLNKKGIQTLLGTIDAHYTDGLFAMLYNGGDMGYEIKRGDKIAQLIVEKKHRASLRQVKEFRIPANGRGQRGFGSSGR